MRPSDELHANRMKIWTFLEKKSFLEISRDFLFRVCYALLIPAQRVDHGRNMRGIRVVHGRNTRGIRVEYA
jgi:hypothetical protein